MGRNKPKNVPLTAAAGVEGAKDPKAAKLPPRIKQPRALRIDDENPQRRTLVYRFGDLDPGFPPAMASLTVAQYTKLHEKLAQYETQTVAEIWGPQSNGCHPYEAEKLPKHSAARLVEVQKDDETHLHSLRLTGAYRVVGILRENVYYVLWIDPRHEVWPWEKKHT